MHRSKVWRRRNVVTMVAIVLLGATTVAVAGSNTPDPKIVERDVTQTDKFVGGEPEIAVNPTNPKNLVWVSTFYKYVHYRPAGDSGPDIDLTAISQIGTNGFFDSMHCFIAFSDDGGETWTPGRFPMGDRTYCGDPMVAAGPDGTFYVSMDWMGSATFSIVPSSSQDNVAGLADNGIGVLSSTDGGRTWHRYGVPTTNPNHDQPIETGTEVDRPFFRVDMAHPGHLYEESGGFSANGRQMAVSKDHGLTWSPVVPHPGTHLAVYDGIVASAGQDTNGQLQFHVSTDDGKTYKTIAVPKATGGSGDWISADPSRRGRFAIMQGKGDNYELFLTPDSGKTWTGPLTIPAANATKPWMDYGPTGALGVMWKDTKSGKVLSVLVQGTAVSRALQVNSVAHEFTSGLGDDLSWITLDTKNTYLGWGDTRNGFCHGYFARIPLTEYRFS